MDHIPVSFDYIIFFGALIISLLLSLLASWFPVRKIASLNTANALRYE
jgi:ABC-type lipoprotein release transport system permease subunit